LSAEVTDVITALRGKGST